MPLKRTGLLAALLCILMPSAAQAVCRVDVQPVVFGQIDLERTSHGRGRVTVSCDEPARFKLAIVGGGERRLRSGGGGQDIGYRLYADAASAQPWGDGGGSGQLVVGSSDGRKPTRLTIYAAIPRQKGVGQGQYADQLQVTLQY